MINIREYLILDDDRRQNAQLFEEAFYSGRNQQPQEPAPDAADAAHADEALAESRNSGTDQDAGKTLQ